MAERPHDHLLASLGTPVDYPYVARDWRASQLISPLRITIDTIYGHFRQIVLL